jgi:exodeoxyribonuclease VII small subunit
MAHDTEITEKMNRIEEVIDQLEADDLSIANAERLHDEGQQLLDECRTLITQGDGEIIVRDG